MLKKINAAGRKMGWVQVYYETITREGNLLKKVATPQIYTKTGIIYPYPFYDYTKTKKSTSYQFEHKSISSTDFYKQIINKIQYNGVNH